MKVLIAVLIACLPSLQVQAQYSGGNGTAGDPYQIATAADLIALGETSEDYDKHFVLTADIDLDPALPGRKVFDKAVIAPDTDPTTWAFRGTPFTGVFDGNGHTISHLTINGANWVGLFGQLGFGASIFNLGLERAEISGTGDCVGGLVGSNNGSIATSYSSSSVNGKRWVGGLVGDNWGNIARSYSAGSVNGTSDVGGLVGQNYYGSISASYSMSVTNGKWAVGGLVGYNHSNSNVEGSYSTGTVRGDDYTGGLVGLNWGTVTASVWDVETSDMLGSDGGIGLTTAEMMTPYMLGLNGLAGHPIWLVDAGRDYPRLDWEGTTGQSIDTPDIDWLAGSGTAEDPYRIDSPDQLVLLSKTSIFRDSCFLLCADIDLDPNLPGRYMFGQAPIPRLSGVFDGGGHVIYNLCIAGGNRVGLIGRLEPGGEVKALGLIHAHLVSNGIYAGALVGENQGSVATSYSIGMVTGRGVVGGLVGHNTGCISTSYSRAAVVGNDHIGGLAGSNGGSIAMSYSSGKVSGNLFGGLVGSMMRNCGDVTSSFWDIQTSGQTTSNGGIGKTTAEMQTASTFLDAGWDFIGETANGTEDIWWILEGQDYPRLWWELDDR